MLGDRAVGICDSPAGLCRRVAAALGRDPDELWFDYFGLNHLGWLRGVHDGERDLLPGLLADDERLASFEEGRLFGGEWLRSLGMIPNEYLFFYYFASDTVGALRSGLESRGEFLLHQQAALLRRERPHARRGARGVARARAASARRRTSPRRTRPPGIAGRRRRGRTSAATRARRSRSSRRSRFNERRVLILEHREPEQPAVPRRATPSSRCRASSAAPASCPSRSATCPATRAR